MIFKIFSPKNLAKKLAFFTQNKAKLCKILIITLVFKKDDNFFAENWQKSPKNCDHNIDPRLGEFSRNGRSFTLGRFIEITKVVQNCVLLFSKV
jgi:hypothetical protein